MPFEFEPQKLVYGGGALGYYRGQTVLVPRALPGERLEVEALRTAKGILHGRPLRVLAAAPDRVDPPCRYFGRCGGCQYQHFAGERQSEAKSEILRESMRRIGKINWNSEIPVHQAAAWGYRNQAEFKVAAGRKGHAELGFFESESHRVCPVNECLILSPRLNTLLREFQSERWSRRIGSCREIHLLADERDERVMLTLRSLLNEQDGAALAMDILSQRHDVSTVALENGKQTKVYGQEAFFYAVGGFRYRVSPGSFFQSSRFLLPKLVEAVTANGGGDFALDVFAGVGLFTLPLAQKFGQVFAAEINPGAIEDLAANARSHQLANVRALAQPAYDFLRRFARPGPDLAVIDPPRAGVGARALKLLTALGPRKINYVSCHPPTLARDLRILLARGYRLNSLEMFDFFPQTFHIESLARLSLDAGGNRPTA